MTCFDLIDLREFTISYMNTFFKNILFAMKTGVLQNLFSIHNSTNMLENTKIYKAKYTKYQNLNSKIFGLFFSKNSL